MYNVFEVEKEVYAAIKSFFSPLFLEYLPRAKFTFIQKQKYKNKHLYIDFPGV